MKTIKPQKLSVLHRTFETAGRVDLCVTLMLGCPFDAPESLLHEAALWKMITAELGKDGAPDAGMPKPRPEVLVLGKAHPEDAPEVRLRMGTIDKASPVGDDEPGAAGLGPIDVNAPEHRAKAGTYDEAWLAEKSPELPGDLDLAYFNVAPPDQQRDAPFEDGEAFAIENMSPDAAVLTGRLPRLRARVFVTLREGELREVPMRLETVQLFPGSRAALVLFRGITPVVEDDASDVRELIAACEEIGAPRPVEHYQAVLAERLDRKRGALAALRDSDLMPPGPASKVSLDEIADPDLASPHENRKGRNADRKTARELEEARARIRAAGLDPDEHLPPQNPPAGGAAPDAPALDEIERVVAEAKAEARKLEDDLEKKREDAEREAQKHPPPNEGGPPKFSAAAEIQKLRDQVELANNAGMRLPAAEAQLADPDLRKKLQATEDALRDNYRRQAHHLAAAPPATGPEADRARVEVMSGAQGGVSFAGRDLTGVDLSGLDLRGVDLRGAFLEGAKLGKTNLAGADLTSAVLARADLAGADLTGAKLAGANLGRANLAGAKVEGNVDLTGAVLAGADLSGASFRGARLGRVDLGEAVFRETDFGGVVGTSITFLRSDLRGLMLAGASFVKCNFIEVDLRAVDLTGADLSAATLVTVDGRGARLRGARLSKLRVVQGSSFEGADFAGAILDGANLRSTKLAACDFSRAALAGADLSECDLRGARFDRAIGPEARFVRADLTLASLVDANLMMGMLGGAKVRGASFLGANLFRADLAKIERDDATVMDEANLTQARIVRARGPREAS